MPPIHLDNEFIGASRTVLLGWELKILSGEHVNDGAGDLSDVGVVKLMGI